MTLREQLLWRGNARWYEFALYLYNIGYVGINTRNLYFKDKFEDITLEAFQSWIDNLTIVRNNPKVKIMIRRMIQIKQKIGEIDIEFYRTHHDTTT